ncbi:MAG: rhodanese-like domain-containing protein [Rhodospirillales bacterium]|nr:rhodanese-like domain-containing protein [Rhodospirillales bacterium]
MESSFFDIIRPDLFLAGVVIGGVIIMMRFMPRLMAGVPFVEPRAVYDLIDGGMELVIIDVRSKDEFNGPLSHIKGAFNLAGMELDNRLAAVDKQLDSLKDAPIFIVCRSHNRSPRAARMLTKAGFTQVAIIKGGMINWNKQELPVAK